MFQMIFICSYLKLYTPLQVRSCFRLPIRHKISRLEQMSIKHADRVLTAIDRGQNAVTALCPRRVCGLSVLLDRAMTARECDTWMTL